MVPWQVLRFKAEVVPLPHILRHIISPVVILVYIFTWCKVSWVYRPIAHMTRSPASLRAMASIASASDDDQVPKKSASTTTSNNARKLFLLTVETTNLFRHPGKKKRWSDHEGSWEIQAASHVWPKNKQMAPPRIAGALSSYTPYTRKSKQWVEITWWKRRTLRNWFKPPQKQLNPRCNILRRQNFEPFNFIMWQYSGDLWV